MIKLFSLLLLIFVSTARSVKTDVGQAGGLRRLLKNETEVGEFGEDGTLAPRRNLGFSGYKTFLSKGSFGYENLGSEAVNKDLRAQRTLIVRRLCNDCAASHKEIFYRRFSSDSNMDYYKNFAHTWTNENNVLGRDFKLYSNLMDAIFDRNAWTYCNYNDKYIGFPRDCGPTGYVPWQWSQFYRHRMGYGKEHIQFSYLII